MDGGPFLVGGGAVDLVELDEVVWTLPPDREEAGSPNVVGAVALAAATRALERIGWDAIRAHDRELSLRLRAGLAAIDGVRLLGPPLDMPTLPIATFVVEGVPHTLMAARLSAEFAIGVRHGCFCAHPYLTRLLGISGPDIERFRAAARRHDRSALPGAVRASAGISTSLADVERLIDAVAAIAGSEPPFEYVADPLTGDHWPLGHPRPDGALAPGTACARG
jgi:selenocysteine lyase/cysteine desulfurase